MKILLVIGLFVSFSGCAQKASMENMSVKNQKQLQYDSKYKNALNVLSVDGGKETNPAWTSQIDSLEFKKALIESLKNAGLYSENSHYTLRVEIIDLEQPMFGIDMTVTMSVKYILEDKEKNIIFTKLIKEPYTATMGDAFSGVKRLRLANEGSARKNIKVLLNEFKGNK